MRTPKWIIIGILLLCYDRIEYLYYAFEGSDRYIPFLFSGEPIRLDAYVYFLSIRVQQIIFILILHILIGAPKATQWVLIAFILSLIEFPLTYNEPFFKIPLPFGFYVPGSTASLKFIAICNLMVVCINRSYDRIH